MPSYSSTSSKRLSECDYRLQLILNEIIKYYDCTILTGHRSKKEQDKAYNSKNSKVKWPKSKHNTKPSVAVDVAPYPIPKDWGKQWKDRVKFYELKALMFYVAKQNNIELRFGGDWNMNGDYTDNRFDDLVHFELVL